MLTVSLLSLLPFVCIQGETPPPQEPPAEEAPQPETPAEPADPADQEPPTIELPPRAGDQEQDGDPEQDPEQDNGEPDLEQIMEEIQELIQVVREDFRKVDDLVQIAREGADAEASGGDTDEFGNRLSDAREQGQVLLDDIEKLLAKLPEFENQGGGGGGGQSQDQPQQNQGRGQDEQNRQQDSDQPHEKMDGQAGDATGNWDGNRPPLGKQQILLFDQSKGAWGNLPPAVRQRLENANSEDIPLRYRRWLEEYHKRSTSPPR